MIKKNKTGNSRKDLSGQGNWPLFRMISVALGVMLVAAAAFFITRPHGQEGVRRIPGQLLETRPVLPYAQFSGKTATAYRYAAETPEVVDRQFCYCYCEKNFGHKTLLTCFTDDHGAKCGICQNEALRAHELLQKGMSMEEIKKAIDAEFRKSKHS